MLDGKHRVYFTLAGDSVYGQLFRADRALDHGAGPVVVTSSGSLPGGLAAGVHYWVILHGVLGGNCIFRLATSARNAAGCVAADITTPGSGLHMLVPAALAIAQA